MAFLNLYVQLLNKVIEKWTLQKGEKNIKITQCMAEGITDHKWSWDELLKFREFMMCHKN
ncbi:hypothetical protein MSIBF_A2840005 [groundwater metagenome]|uniref:Uncharacterized protein n=1 Tax=groundwater metagenome TaxID=717931 RepID=A0A098EBG8_9ZZZZ